MVPGATAAAVTRMAWEDLVSTRGSALAEWRFEPGSMPEQNNSSSSSSADAWISHASQRDMQSLTLALQRELCSNNLYNFEPSSLPGSGATAAGAGAGVSAGWTGSEWKCKSESDVSSGSEAGGRVGGGGGCAIESPYRQVKNNGPSVRGKVSKRRSRAANKTPITFLNADPANFRAMVQQVTGVPLNPNATRLWSGASVPGLVRPEPKRPSAAPGGGSSAGAGFAASCSAAIQGLPTLDTSALFIASSASASASVRGGTSSSYTFAPPPPPLVRTAAASHPQNEEFLLTEKLRAACMQSLFKNGGDGGFLAVDQTQGMLNFSQETDSWFNNNPDGELSGNILL